MQAGLWCAVVWAAVGAPLARGAETEAAAPRAVPVAPKAAAAAEPLDLVLPTPNSAIYDGNGPGFYQYVNRNYKGVTSHPWEGGQYGMVRNPEEYGGKLVYTRFHEGLDIKPVKRDANGEPLDPVYAVSAGKVVYVNRTPGRSNYGHYVVIEHVWGGCPYYSLYGHLGSVAVADGAKVARGQTIGRMGYTGVGIDKPRAHLHFEINLLVSREFNSWHKRFFPSDPNWHGIYNGLNLNGIDCAKLFLALKADPGLTMPGFLRREEVMYKVLLPDNGRFELVKRYPWLAGGLAEERPPSWEVSFNRFAIPVACSPSAKAVETPALAWAKSTGLPYSYMTKGIVTTGPALSASGLRQLLLYIWGD